MADDAATAYGDYYAWGEVATYYTKKSFTAYNAGKIDTWNTAADKKSTYIAGAKTGYDWQNYYGSSDVPQAEPWSPAPYDESTNVLKPEYDIVYKTYGGSWRMPTNSDFENLFTACGTTQTSQWTENITSTDPIERGKGVYSLSVEGCTVNSVKYNVPGALFITSDTDKSKCLFFPAAGIIDGTTIGYVGKYGCYWSSSLRWDGVARRLTFYIGGTNSPFTPNNDCRFYGYQVRPVCPVAE